MIWKFSRLWFENLDKTVLKNLYTIPTQVIVCPNLEEGLYFEEDQNRTR
jgi:hypothetical protein